MPLYVIILSCNRSTKLSNLRQKLDKTQMCALLFAPQNSCFLSRMTHLYFARVDDVEVVSLVSLLDDDLPGDGVDREHGVEDVGALVLVQVGEEHVLGDGLGQ